MIAHSINDIDVNFDVQTDSGGKDPDYASPTLRSFHQLLWSKLLPNGMMMKLEVAKDCYLKWNGICFGSDSITATFRNGRNKHFEEFKKGISDYQNYEKHNLSILYTIGGEIIFPQTPWSMNRARGCHPKICDRWDLTLECIRRCYAGEPSPLDKALLESKRFFDLFVDFKGYVDFFFLQDCVDEYYNVKFWLDTPLFENNPIPETLDSYLTWVDSQIEFVANRNKRITEYCLS